MIIFDTLFGLSLKGHHFSCLGPPIRHKYPAWPGARLSLKRGAHVPCGVRKCDLFLPDSGPFLGLKPQQKSMETNPKGWLLRQTASLGYNDMFLQLKSKSQVQQGRPMVTCSLCQRGCLNHKRSPVGWRKPWHICVILRGSTI